MLSTFDLILYSFLALFLLPIAVISLVSGSKQPEGSVFARYFAASPYLGRVGDVFLLILCGKAVAKVAQHFGFIDPALGEQITTWSDPPFLILLVILLALWVQAFLRVRRANQTG